MTSPPFSDEEANELFNRVVRHHELELQRNFGDFMLMKSTAAGTLTLYRKRPPTRAIYPVIVIHDNNTVAIENPDLVVEALDALRQLQVLKDMSDL